MIPSLRTLNFTESDIKYDGNQLSPHWIFRELDLQGNAVVAFQGISDVSLAHMVDLEDVKKKAPIYSPRMLHFLGEFFIDSLDAGILLQHFFVGEVYESLWEHGVRDLRRRGNDIYYKDRKFSVSIATKSHVSVLMHVGLNIQTENTPIPTSGLAEMGIDAVAFAKKILNRFSADVSVWNSARTKVLPR